MARTASSRSAVGGDDHGVVAAKLQQRPPQPGGDHRADLAPHAGRAGGADQRQAPVGDHGRADVTLAEDDLQQAVRPGAERF